MKFTQPSLFGGGLTTVERRTFGGPRHKTLQHPRPDGSERRTAESGEKSCGDCRHFMVRTYPNAECVHAKCHWTHTGSTKTNIAARDVACKKFKPEKG